MDPGRFPGAVRRLVQLQQSAPVRTHRARKERALGELRIDHAPDTDKPTLTLESVDVVDYGLNRVLRVRFRSDEARGSLHWTVIGFFNSSDTISLAHVGTPENREEGLAALEAIVTTLRFD
jgi:hypothetical protein